MSTDEDRRLLDRLNRPPMSWRWQIALALVLSALAVLAGTIGLMRGP